MKTSRLSLATGFALAAALLAFGCDDSGIPGGPPLVDDVPDPSVVTVGVDGQSFTVATSTIDAGWTTLEFRNQSDHPHFVVVGEMPAFQGEQMTVEDSRAEIVPVFQNFMDTSRGEAPSFPEAGFELPAWYEDVVFMGGPGLTSAGGTSRTTLNLTPGIYVIECFVKTGEGVFHSTEDMVAGLRVTDPSEEDGRVARSP